MATDIVKFKVEIEPPTHIISLTTMVTGPEQWAKIFSQFSELAENLGSQYPSVTVSSQHYEFEEEEELETHNEDTLFKVQQALAKVMPLRDIYYAISELQNAGILFRERR